MARTPEQIREGRRRSAAKKRRENPEKYREIQRRCRANGGAERERVYKQRLKEERPFLYHRQFARRFNPEITEDDLRELWEAQDGRCGLTGRQLEHGNAHLDHIVPVKRGGSHDLSNLRWVCAEVNFAKRDLTDDEFLALCLNVAYWIGRRLMEYGQGEEDAHDH